MPSSPITNNPGILGDDELVQSFVVRKQSLELILEALRENLNSSGANRNVLIIGPRGTGKTMLVRRAAAEIRSNPSYNLRWYPIVFGEESYSVSTPGEFWLEALFHLASETGDNRLNKAWMELHQELDEARLRERTLGLLFDFSDREKRRLLIIVENLNMLIGEQMSHEAAWELRHTLLNESRLMLLGTAISRFDEIISESYAWFEMFTIHDLPPLGLSECNMLWESVSGSSLEQGPLKAVRILTGGNPRLLSLLASFAVNHSFYQLMDQLVRLIDDHTEYFKSHLDSLATKERKVFVALLDCWDPVSSAEISKRTRLGVNEASALLNRLVQHGAVEVAKQKGRRKLYQAAERLYNIYYLMRRRGRPEGRVRAAVNFMVLYYKGQELAARMGDLAREACTLPEQDRKDHYLAYAEILRQKRDLRQRIITCTPLEFLRFSSIPSNIRDLSKEALLSKIVSLSIQGKLREAEESIRELIEEDAHNAIYWNTLGGILREDKSRLEEAEQACRKATDIEPDEPHFWSNLALVLSEENRHEQCTEALNKAIGLDPKSVEHWCNLASEYIALKQYSEAEPIIRKVIELDPLHEHAWGKLGIILFELEKYSEAKQAFLKQLELTPDQAFTWRSLGVVEIYLDEKSDAERAFRKAIELDPNEPEYCSDLGHLLIDIESEKAEEFWTKALELHSELIGCATHLLVIHEKRGADQQTLLREASDWIDRSQRKASLLSWMARFIMKFDDALPQAESWAREAYSKDKGVAITENLMLVLALSGKWKEAIQISSPVLAASATEDELQNSMISFAINAAAAGYSREILKQLSSSKGADSFEPLMVGLQIHNGESPIVAKEIMEIAQDIVKSIQEASAHLEKRD
jgi:Flp pilus assembly protein TadD